MSDRSGFVFNLHLKADTPPLNIRKALSYLLPENQDGSKNADRCSLAISSEDFCKLVDNHPTFVGDPLDLGNQTGMYEWWSIFRANAAYYPCWKYSNWWDFDSSEEILIRIAGSSANYRREVELFLNWLKPWLKPSKFVVAMYNNEHSQSVQMWFYPSESSFIEKEVTMSDEILAIDLESSTFTFLEPKDLDMTTFLSDISAYGYHNAVQNFGLLQPHIGDIKQNADYFVTFKQDMRTALLSFTGE